MNDQDRARFVSNVHWFNQFFAGIRQLYGVIVENLPSEFFPKDFKLASTNYYFTKQNFAPTIPPYYALILDGREQALQVMAVFDPELFAGQGLFAVKPSIIVVLHSQAHKYAYIDDYALRLIKNREIEITHQADGRLWGKMNSRPPAGFFSFQVSFDEFSADHNPHDAVREHIVNPIVANLSSVSPE